MVDYSILTTIVLSLALLAWLWIGPFSSLRRDNFRADIRRLRDELFDFMWQNGYSFDCPSYRRVRQSLNGMLRLSQTIDPVMFIMTAAARWSMDRDIELVTEEDKTLRDALEKTLARAAARCIRFLFLEGFGGCMLKGILLFAALEKARKWARAKSGEWLTRAYILEGLYNPVADCAATQLTR